MPPHSHSARTRGNRAIPRRSLLREPPSRRQVSFASSLASISAALARAFHFLDRLHRTPRLASHCSHLLRPPLLLLRRIVPHSHAAHACLGLCVKAPRFVDAISPSTRTHFHSSRLLVPRAVSSFIGFLWSNCFDAVPYCFSYSFRLVSSSSSSRPTSRSCCLPSRILCLMPLPFCQCLPFSLVILCPGVFVYLQTRSS
jgi:hypothetical protein